MSIGDHRPGEFDLRFSLLGVPVRVSPAFWIVSLLLGLGGDHEPAAIAIWMLAVFFSILVHEFGHALVARSFGFEPQIILHGFGGLAVYHAPRQSSAGRIAISAAGPLAGFLLALVVIGATLATDRRAPFFDFELGGNRGYEDWRLGYVVVSLLYINILWGVLNLLPILPLDGGHICLELLRNINPPEAVRITAGISLLVAASVAIVALQRFGQMYTAIMFGYLAWNNYELMRGPTWR